MAELRKFEVVPDEEPPLIQTEPAPAKEQGVAIAMMMLALKSLSQRALTAATDLFTLLTVGSAFWLWLSIPEPTDRQLVQLLMYGLFVTGINVIVRRK